MTKEFGSKRGKSGERNDWDEIPTLELKQGCTTCSDGHTFKFSLITKGTRTCEESEGVSPLSLESR